MEEFIPATILVIIFSWFTSFFVSYSDFDARQHKVDAITYNYTQLAAKKGSLTPAMYSELEKELSKLGEFDIYAWAEKYNSTGTKTKTEGKPLVGYDLRENDYDILNVSARAKKDHSLTFFYKAATFGPTGFSSNIRINSQATSYIQ